ncbi:hypothetical protein ILUMI_10652 [Ignelater luminosus]|uniref:Methylglutaconyl-CoA hydratase, mitochondrial n=1 Tax=Ignelater luminosus TaxID=2038154 RepID=A0A8K0CXG3_IGNLU|nr:hypothetical protein ILUMI_10652 [Ignelater luminosus]
MACIQRIQKCANFGKLLLQKRSFAVAAQQAQRLQKEVTLQHLDGIDKGVTVIDLNRVERRNALGVDFVSTLNGVVDDVLNNETIKVLIIKSSVPGVFCAGADLKERINKSLKESIKLSNTLRGMMNKIHNLPMPVIAAIDGTALGGGLEIALACDMRVTTKTTKLGLVETRLAIIPGGGGTSRLPRLINPAVAKEMILTAKIVDGKEALHSGLVNHAVEQNEKGDAAYQKSLDIAREILPNGPIAVRMAKFAINKGVEVDLSAASAIEEACYAQIIPTSDRMEGLIAFSGKRSPKYKGE